MGRWDMAVLCGIFVTIFRSVIGWRVMRAHERIADSLSSQPPPAAQAPPRGPEAPATQ